MGAMNPWPDSLTAYQHEVMEPLVTRLLAGNASAYTFTGTQTYVVGLGSGADCAVIDPGPAEADHIDAIVALVGQRRLAAILCTHTHRDHSPAAAPLSERTGAPIIGCAPLTLDDDGPRADAAFDADYRPDRVLMDGESIHGDGWTLTAVATPGHTSNHLCFALDQTKALFTGDHVMTWSTSVVSPPDGDMGNYMESLAKLYDRDDRIYYAAHGAPATKPKQLVRGMIGHRKQRERQILKLLDTAPHAIPDMVAAMYKGLDPRLIGAAGRSVLAHLLDLEKRGQVQAQGETWSMTA